MTHNNFVGSYHLISGYVLSIALVGVYVNLYGLWKFLSATLDKSLLQILPVVITVAVLAVIILVFRSRKQSGLITTIPAAVVTGLLFCIAALFLPDPHVPVKRIHVVEYLLLSLVIRYAMSYRLQSLPLLFFSACFTLILGVHDEFLQGLHPLRTYGVRDMAVNGLAAIGGALLWHGLGLYDRYISPVPQDDTMRDIRSFLYLAWLLAAIIGLVWPLAFYRSLFIPIWPAMPLLGATIYYILYKNVFNHSWGHGLAALSTVSFLLILYPVIAHVGEITFY